MTEALCCCCCCMTVIIGFIISILAIYFTGTGWDNGPCPVFPEGLTEYKVEKSLLSRWRWTYDADNDFPDGSKKEIKIRQVCIRIYSKVS